MSKRAGENGDQRGDGATAKKAKGEGGVYYNDYLKIDDILELQQPLSGGGGRAAAHDEMLFIITHQTYELWFKQIQHEIDFVRGLFLQPTVEGRQLGQACQRLERVVEIQKVLNSQVSILQTMQPLDFLEFRDFLFPASGFQSVQFRQLEIKLGLESKQRFQYQSAQYYHRFNQGHQDLLHQTEAEPSLLKLVQAWLERIPFLEMEGYSFWKEYAAAVERMLGDDKETIEGNSALSQEEKDKALKELDGTRESFESLFSEERHNELKEKGLRRFSHKAAQAALLILLYQDQPILQQPHRLLSLLVDIDEQLTTWRHRHAMMVHRMLGTKIGTGGSSGYHYLRSTVSDRYRVFVDLFNMSTYLLPRSYQPALPTQVGRALGFRMED